MKPLTKDEAIEIANKFFQKHSPEDRIALARACVIISMAVWDGAFGLENALELMSSIVNSCSEFSREIA